MSRPIGFLPPAADARSLSTGNGQLEVVLFMQFTVAGWLRRIYIGLLVLILVLALGILLYVLLQHPSGEVGAG